MPLLTQRRTRRKPDRPALPAASQQSRILCVDDDDDLTRIIKARLRRFHVEVSRACSGKEGLKLAHSHRPDAIITDLGMSDGDGEFLLRRLKSRPSTMNIPVIVISGVDDMERKAQVHKLGAAAILHKPFRFEQLYSELTAHLNWPDETDDVGDAQKSQTYSYNGRRLRMDASTDAFRPAFLGRP